MAENFYIVPGPRYGLGLGLATNAVLFDWVLFVT